MMEMIRNLRPLTKEEWKYWYLKNVHDEKYLLALAEEMYQSIPESDRKTFQITYQVCLSYIYDVMFRRTFEGNEKEKQALRILQKALSPDIQEAPIDWDTNYFIDFYLKDSNDVLVGIQLKPESFFIGEYQKKVDIDGKMEAFRQMYSARTYVLIYRKSSDGNGIDFVNPQVIDEIKKSLQ